jgi:hypothetical protein
VSFVYTPAKELLAKGDLDLDEAGHDLRLLLVMTNTTADTEQDTGLISAFTTLDEYDGAGYSRAALASQVVTRDDPNNRAELSATSPVSFGATVAAGTRSAQAAILYRHVGADSANIPIAFIDSGGFPLNGAGGPFEFAINAEGILQVT